MLLWSGRSPRLEWVWLCSCAILPSPKGEGVESVGCGVPWGEKGLSSDRKGEVRVFCLLPEAELDLFKILAPLELAFFLSRGDLRSFDFFISIPPIGSSWHSSPLLNGVLNFSKLYLQIPIRSLCMLWMLPSRVIHISNHKISFLGASWLKKKSLLCDSTCQTSAWALSVVFNSLSSWLYLLISTFGCNDSFVSDWMLFPSHQHPIPKA